MESRRSLPWNPSRADAALINFPTSIGRSMSQASDFSRHARLIDSASARDRCSEDDYVIVYKYYILLFLLLLLLLIASCILSSVTLMSNFRSSTCSCPDSDPFYDILNLGDVADVFVANSISPSVTM